MKDFFKILIAVLLVLTTIGTLFVSFVLDSQDIDELYDYDLIVSSLSGLAARSDNFLGAILAFEISDVIIFEFDPNRDFHLFYYFDTVGTRKFANLAFSYTSFSPNDPYKTIIYRTSNIDFFIDFMSSYFDLDVNPDFLPAVQFMVYDAFVLDYPDTPSEILNAIITFFNDILGIIQQLWYMFVFFIRSVLISMRGFISLSLVPIELLFVLLKFAFPLP